MDVLTDCRYFIDIDRYRKAQRDWDAIASYLSMTDCYIVLAGWFSLDGIERFDAIEKSFKGKVYRYDGGGKESLGEFIARLNHP